jgi:phage portal protein BeeE
VPLKLYDSKNRIENHPILDLIRAPNPLQSGVELMEAFYAFLQIAGNTYLETVNLSNGEPGELYVLRPDRMSIIPDPRLA